MVWDVRYRPCTSDEMKMSTEQPEKKLEEGTRKDAKRALRNETAKKLKKLLRVITDRFLWEQPNPPDFDPNSLL